MSVLQSRKLVKTRTVRRRTPRLGALFEFLLMTSAIAASAGVGFGCALRFNRPEQPGSTILHSEQSFPARQDWPISTAPDFNP
ncbi:MAG: hypothetical protein AB4426_27505 [Xenococcaceae cyanobacterium]